MFNKLGSIEAYICVEIYILCLYSANVFTSSLGAHSNYSLITLRFTLYTRCVPPRGGSKTVGKYLKILHTCVQQIIIFSQIAVGAHFSGFSAVFFFSRLWLLVFYILHAYRHLSKVQYLHKLKSK